MRTLLLSFTFLGVAAGGTVGWRTWFGNGHVDDEFQTEAVTRGDLLATFSATGTVEPEDVIDVGAQVAGQIRAFGVDPKSKKPVDYGSAVEPGSVLALIDDSLYRAKVQQSQAHVRSMESKVDQAKAKVEQAKAKLEQARANVQRADADILQARAKYDQADRDWDRARRLGPRGVISQLDFDTAQATYETTKAAVAVAVAAQVQSRAAVLDAEAAVKDAEAAVGDAEAAVLDARAVLRQDEINLGYCTITSPVKGVIVDRRVTLGQTVQSSFNTPSLFLLAIDLKRMKVWASVNEADIGQVRVGQPVTFTVDAYAGKLFKGEVGLIRYNAAMTQNVVTYTVEVETDNSAGLLLPYLTANLKFEVGRRSAALLVSNAALRWQPAPDQIASDARAETGKPRRSSVESTETEGGEAGTVWVTTVDGEHVRPLKLKLGLSDSVVTEVVEGDLADGQRVVIGDAQPTAAAPEATTNPFAPPQWGKKKR
jgi:HlyD family secretion protein